LNIKIIKDFYWDEVKYRRLRADKRINLPCEDVFQFADKGHLIHYFTDTLIKYIKKLTNSYSNKPIQDLNNYIIMGGSKKEVEQEGSYRRRLSKLISSSPFNFDYILIKDVFSNATEFKNAVLTISVQDLIYIFNNLIKRSGQILIKEHPQDPIRQLLDALKPEKIKIKGKGKDKLFISEEMLEYQLNFEIESRVLVSQSQITKCRDCNAAVYPGLIPDERWRRVEDNNASCKDSIFKRYQNDDLNEEVNVFEALLQYLPLIDIHQSLDDIIEVCLLS